MDNHLSPVPKKHLAGKFGRLSSQPNFLQRLKNKLAKEPVTFASQAAGFEIQLARKDAEIEALEAENNQLTAQMARLRWEHYKKLLSDFDQLSAPERIQFITALKA
jgi:hypothetical protein